MQPESATSAAVEDTDHQVKAQQPSLPTSPASTESLKRPITSSPSTALDSDSKRQKITTMEPKTRLRPANEILPIPVSTTGLEPAIPIMPPSLELITGVKADLRASRGHIGQEEVGVIGYVGGGNAAVNGVIKQRFTDFMVNEVGMDGQVVHLTNIGKPKEPKPEPTEKPKAAEPTSEATPTEEEKQPEPLPESLQFETRPGWTEETTRRLQPHFSEETIVALRALFVEGKEPPRKSDGGWGSRPVKPAEPVLTAEEEAMNVSAAPEASAEEAAAPPAPAVGSSGSGRGQGRDRGRGRGRGDRGGRGGRGGGGFGGRGPVVKDDREVLSQVITSKEGRTGCHTVIREVFRGLFDSGTKAEGENSRIVLTYARAGVSRTNGWNSGNNKPSTKHLPPYIHFTLQKTNRETQDALAYISRQIGCPSKDLGIAGTKDKRAVTVQRVSIKRGHKTMDQIWKAINGLKGSWSAAGEKKVINERAERGARVGDFKYEAEGLDLGLLKGNEFRITLRNVQGESDEAINATLGSLRDKGFINFYGMQRFGTSSVPTHITGLFILQSRWADAVTSILSLRQNEHPDCVRGRLAWLDEGDIEKALKEMPRRCVAERNIWEFWKRTGASTDYLGALGTIPRNLRTMYVHAYQSYIWNLITSERIKLSSTSALPGDLVIVKGPIDVDPSARPAVETSSSQIVKHLTEEDVGQHTIFDVVHPLPGFDVEFPKGRIGDLYRDMLRADGLDIDHMRRDQREYSLPGSYRPIINRPQSLSWSIVRYTDPNLPLVQSDEDRLLGLNPPSPHDPEGMFRAVVLVMILGPASYATMALREVTREETSSWWQTSLTVKGEDQGFRDGAGLGGDEGEGGDEVEGEGGEGEEGAVLGETDAGEKVEVGGVETQ